MDNVDNYVDNFYNNPKYACSAWLAKDFYETLYLKIVSCYNNYIQEVDT